MVRYIVRTTSRVQPLVKADLPLPGDLFTIGGRTWRFTNHGRFAVISTMTDTLPFSAVVIPPSAAAHQAATIGRELDMGLAPRIGNFVRGGALPTAGGGVQVAA